MENAEVVALNDAGAVFCVLAAQIRGTAVDWPASALSRLEAGLRAQYEHALGLTSEAAIEQLLVLAQERKAA